VRRHASRRGRTRGRTAPVEGAARVAEELGPRPLGDQGPQLTDGTGARRAGAWTQRLGHPLLARAALAGEQHGDGPAEPTRATSEARPAHWPASRRNHGFFCEG